MKRARIVAFTILLLLSAVAVLYYYVSRPYASSEIRISTNPWVGFTPFIYAQEKGWLEGTPFRFMWLVDLTDNARLYERGFTQGFTATQYELLRFADRRELKPVFLIDHSYGADAIVSNKTLRELRSFGGIIDVYLEKGSLNEDFFEAFVQAHRLESVRFRQVDASQKKIVTLAAGEEPVVIISYAPYLSELLKKGFSVIESTRTMNNFYVVDALFVDERFIREHPKEFVHLRELFKMGVERLRENPREFYDTVRGYLEGQTYEEFMASVEQIEWLHDNVPDTIRTYLHVRKIQTDRLLP